MSPSNRTFELSVPGWSPIERMILSLIAVLVLQVSLLAMPRPALSATPEIVNGVLDLRDSEWTFETEAPIVLDKWEFFGNRMLSGEDFEGSNPPRSDVTMDMPGYWTGLETPEGPMKRHGFATLHLTILLPSPSESLAMQLGNVLMAYELDVGSQLVGERGQIGTSAATAKSYVTHNIVAIPDGLTTVDLTLRIANFEDGRGGGSKDRMVFGSERTILAADARKTRLAWFLGGVLIILGAYHIGLFTLRPQDRSTLWFGLLCISLFMRAFYAWYDYLTVLTGPELHWVTFKANGFFTMAICPTITLYVASIFPQETLKWLVRIIIVYSIVQTGIFLLPGKIWSDYFYTLYGLAFLALLSTCYTSIMAVIHGRNESVILLLGWTVYGIATVISVLNIAQFVSVGETFQYGFMFFVAAQAYLLSKRFSRAFNQVETLSSELSVSNQRLQRLDELKNQFLANTSHELRTPLNGIIGLTEALRAGSKGPVSAAVDRSLAMIAASGRRLSMLVNDILDAEKLRNHDIELSRRAVDLHEIAGSVLQLSQSLADTKSLELRNDVPTDLPPVDADENRLQQILQNLIGNAIKFTPSGSVTVSAAEHDDDGIEIRVSDTGIGIPADKFDTIFRSFEQGDASTEREFGGTGLGLSITKKLVELHGGTIAVDSEPGRGSCFTFTLKKAAADAERSGIPSLKPEQEPAWPQPIVLPDKPAEVQDAGAARPAIAEGNGNGNGHRPTVLVVDDDEVNRNVVADFLGLRSYDVLEAEDGEKALALMRENQPDIVLLDIMMPKMNGYEVCRQIRSEYDEADMPIIFLSAKDHMEDVVAGFESGGNDYLPKPVAGPELLARVATHLKLLNIQDTMVKEEKLAAIGQVASGIVHDFKNSINIIRGYAEMIAAEEDEPGSEAAAFAATISAEADRIAAMTHEIVDYARGGIRLELEEIAVDDFLERVRAAIRPAFDLKHCRFEIVDEAHGTLRIDSARMIGAFATIAGNACDVMSADGTFAIRARRDGKTVTFELADDGPGIPEDIRDRLFDPFGTFGKDGGTGLGMALVQSIVDAHGGTIRFETEIGKGTTFFIEIPEAEEGAPRA